MVELEHINYGVWTVKSRSRQTNTSLLYHQNSLIKMQLYSGKTAMRTEVSR